ncbi:MAG: NAD(P)/FAD-dependent oxidoreductase [Muribaculaceae bacterium]|nr:NAD(P)/FAD-dependent oxidoreductase [Muribaculaceae bacterium]
MTRETTLSLLPQQAVDNNYILKNLRKKKELKDIKINSFRIIRKSIDARKNPVKINLGILVSNQDKIEPEISFKEFKKLKDNSPEIIIVGAGPAGLFAGLKAIELGIRPIIIERGKDVDSRKPDIADISRKGEINPDSNYCFGEGGAGAFSDGKLYTRSKKRGNVNEVLALLHQFGASEEILIQSHPHIGSDKLPKIIKNIRNKIIECGGEVRFNCRMDGIKIENGKVKGIYTSAGDFIKGDVVLATGHSARDTYRLLKELGIEMESKGIAVGVRLEHPQELIDRIQYHNEEGRGSYLPPAEYSFVDQADGRGVYSFCMCPGGVIVPAVSGEGQIVVNGMSASARSGKWADSGYVVELHPGDINGFSEHEEFEMMALQESLEAKLADASHNTLVAPAQRISDFINGETSTSLPSTSYAPGIYPDDFNKLFPKEISGRLKQGLLKIGERCPEFISNEGVMIGLESRTSSPVRIPRDPETMQHKTIEGLYPVGEGAGYAGGIVSSAIDGIKSVEAFYKTRVLKNA